MRMAYEALCKLTDVGWQPLHVPRWTIQSVGRLWGFLDLMNVVLEELNFHQFHWETLPTQQRCKRIKSTPTYTVCFPNISPWISCCPMFSTWFVCVCVVFFHWKFLKISRSFPPIGPLQCFRQRYQGRCQSNTKAGLVNVQGIRKGHDDLEPVFLVTQRQQSSPIRWVYTDLVVDHVSAQGKLV